MLTALKNDRAVITSTILVIIAVSVPPRVELTAKGIEVQPD